MLEALASDRGASALLLFPTKALAQDQLRALRAAVVAAFGGDDAPSVEVRAVRADVNNPGRARVPTAHP